MKKNILFLFLITVFYSCQTSAQSYYSTKNKKAIKLFEKALQADRDIGIIAGSLENKAAYAQKAVDKDPNFVEAYFLLSDAKAQLGNLEEAIEARKKGLSINPNYSKVEYFYLADMQMKADQYQDGAKTATTFLTFKNTNDRQRAQASLFIQNASFIENALKNPVQFNPVNLGKNINSSQSEYHPTIMGDENTIIYTRTIRDDRVMGMRKEHEDLYVSIRSTDGEWQVSESVSEKINTLLNEGSSTISADGNYLIFTSCAGYEGYGRNRNGMGSCDLFYCKKIGKRWSAPRNLGAPVNTNFWESQPCFSADGRTLYFIQNRTRNTGDRNNQDIYVTTLTNEGYWSKPTPLPGTINTPFAEQTIFAHPDGQTIYFASNGHPGMGGLDLFLSRKNEKGEWSTPINLGYPINTSDDEDGIIVSPNGKRAYFASTREGGFGQSDLYYFDLPEQVRPVLTTYMKGVVYDADSKLPLEAQFELIDLATGETILSNISNDMTGEFLVNIPTNKELALNVAKPGYFFYSKNYTFNEKDKQEGKPYLIDVPLEKIEVSNKGFVLENVFFDVAKYELKPASKVELNKLYDLLVRNKTIKVELGGHTDSDGDDAKNQLLSENRAKAVVEYLVEKGIAKDRLSYKGYGETQPVVPNDSPENKAKNRRTEVKIIGK